MLPLPVQSGQQAVLQIQGREGVPTSSLPTLQRAQDRRETLAGRPRSLCEGHEHRQRVTVYWGVAVVSDSVIPRTAACKAPLSKGCPRILGVGWVPDPQGGPPPGDLPNAGTEHGSPAWQGASREASGEGLAFTLVAGEGSEGV